MNLTLLLLLLLLLYHLRKYKKLFQIFFFFKKKRLIVDHRYHPTPYFCVGMIQYANLNIKPILITFPNEITNFKPQPHNYRGDTS